MCVINCASHGCCESHDCTTHTISIENAKPPKCHVKGGIEELSPQPWCWNLCFYHIVSSFGVKTIWLLSNWNGKAAEGKLWGCHPEYSKKMIHYLPSYIFMWSSESFVFLHIFCHMHIVTIWHVKICDWIISSWTAYFTLIITNITTLIEHNAFQPKKKVDTMNTDSGNYLWSLLLWPWVRRKDVLEISMSLFVPVHISCLLGDSHPVLKYISQCTPEAVCTIATQGW